VSIKKKKMRSLAYIVSLFMVIALFVLSGCTKEEGEGLEGVFTGTFNRVGPTVRAGQADVTLYLANGKFSGTSSREQFPAICSGTFSLKGGQITAKNACFFTANFDWTLILDGTFTYELSGDRLILQRSYEEGVYDRYELRRDQ
jgi:hypothetical protein